MSAGLRITVLLTMALGSWPLAAEILTGRVLEDHLGDPLASVELRVAQDGARQVVAVLETGTDGRFRADIPEGKYTIAVSHIRGVHSSERRSISP